MSPMADDPSSSRSPRSPERRDRRRQRHPLADPGRLAPVQAADHGPRAGDGPEDVRLHRPPAARTRTIFVVTRDRTWRGEGVRAVAVGRRGARPGVRARAPEIVLVAGGGEIYRGGLAAAGPAGDHRGRARHRPVRSCSRPSSSTSGRETAREPHDGYAFVSYRRTPSGRRVGRLSGVPSTARSGRSGGTGRHAGFRFLCLSGVRVRVPPSARPLGDDPPTPREVPVAGAPETCAVGAKAPVASAP